MVGPLGLEPTTYGFEDHTNSGACSPKGTGSTLAPYRKASIGSKGTPVVLDSTKASMMLAANLWGAQEFAASTP